MSQTREIEWVLNGEETKLSVPVNKTLIELLREELRLTGTTEGCGVGVCGSCTVLVDGKTVSSCLELAVNVDGKTVETVEGLGDPDTEGGLHPLQAAFIDHEGFQCGYCTPGMLMTSLSLLRDVSNPSRADIEAYLSENICRCTGYKGIVQSIESVIGDVEYP